MNRKIISKGLLILLGFSMILNLLGCKKETVSEVKAGLEIFEFSESGYNPGINISLQGSKLIFENRDERKTQRKKVDDEILSNILNSFDKFDVYSWDGFNECDEEVLDGMGFSLYVKLTDGRVISATGENVFPKNYREFKNEILGLFEGERVEEEQIEEEQIEEETEETDEQIEEEQVAEEQIEETSPDQVYKDNFIFYDERFNSDPLNLTPSIGEFFSADPEADDAFGYVSDPNGDTYGFAEDLTGGCSVWCSVGDYRSTVLATSSLAPIGSNTYEPCNLEDRNRNTAWADGVDGDGIGEKIFINRTYVRGGDVPESSVSTEYDSFFFPELCIVNGLAKSEDAFYKNNRVKSMKMFFNDEYICTLELLDTYKPQYISLSGLHLSAKSGEESCFTFEIEDVYKGSKYDDTVITGIEIEMFTQNH